MLHLSQAPFFPVLDLKLAGVVLMGLTLFAGAGVASAEPIDIGSRRELFVDDHLVGSMRYVEYVLHHPVKAPPSDAPFPEGYYATVIADEDEQGTLYRAYWRGLDPTYTGGTGYSGHPGEVTRYAESRDGVNWVRPDLGLYEMDGDAPNNAVLAGMPPFSHNFTPFLDTRPGVDPNERYKALAGHPGPAGSKDADADLAGRGLHAFVSADGIHWKKKGEVIPYQREWRHAFDSQNVAFWSEAEQAYVCYFRTYTPSSHLRSISRTTSRDFETWTEPVPMHPNRTNEHLYTSQTQPYFRAPHIYVALPTRYVAGRVGSESTHAMLGSTDILFMATRPGASRYSRLFAEAFLRPGLDPANWKNRANFVALNIIPTSEQEMSIYHKSGDRYVLRTDGFISVHADAQKGELITKPFTFEGDELLLNYSTSAGGQLQVELLDADGEPIPDFGLNDAPLIVGDEIDRSVQWAGDLQTLQGTPVRLRFVMLECDLYSFRFR